MVWYRKTAFNHDLIVIGLMDNQVRQRLVLLMDAVQYAVNRLDADKSQPQVAGELAIALAIVKRQGA